MRARYKISPPFIGRLIFAQMNAQPYNELFTPVREAVQALNECSTEHVQKICEAAADYFYWDKDHTLNLT
jgi:hypothetical protein